MIGAPALCERADLESLVQHSLRRFRCELGRAVREVDPEALAMLRAHRWPGNVRALQGVLKQALLRVSDDDAVIKQHEQHPIHAGFTGSARP